MASRISGRFVSSMTLAERFWSKVARGDGCWLWKGGLGGKRGWRYGYIWFSGRMERAHRIMWLLTYGELASGFDVLHRCDQTQCVNPEHLFLGTAADNMRDAAQKGRTAKGENSGSRLHPERIPHGSDRPNAKLTEKIVQFIRTSNEPGRLLAERFGVHASAVSMARNRVTWKHVGR